MTDIEGDIACTVQASLTTHSQSGRTLRQAKVGKSMRFEPERHSLRCYRILDYRLARLWRSYAPSTSDPSDRIGDVGRIPMRVTASQANYEITVANSIGQSFSLEHIFVPSRNIT